VAANRGSENVPEKPVVKDLTKDMIEFVSKKMHHDINPSEVVAVYQLRNRRVLIKFSSVKEKVELMRARRKMDIRTCYVNDQMTRIGGDLCKKCRELRKKNQLAYVWTRLGKIYIKRSEDSKTIEIQCDEDVEKVTKNG